MPFNVSYQIEAIDKFSATSKKVEKAVGKLNKRVDKFSKNSTARFRNVAAGFGSLFAVAGAGMAGSKFFQVATTFEDSLLSLSAITGAAGKDLAKLKEASFSLGKQFSTSGASVLQGMDLIASQRPELLKNIPALIGVTKEALKLKNAAGLAFPEVARIVGKSLNQFNLKNEDAADVVNTLAASSQAGTARIGDIGAALLNSAQSAAEAGFTFGETVSILQLMAKTSKGGAEDGVKLRNFISILTDEGVNFNKLGPHKGILKVKEALGKIKDPMERAAMINKVFGRETKEGALSILNSVDSMKAFETAITGTNKAEELANINLGSMSAKFRSLGVAIEEKIVPIFDKLKPVLEKLGTEFADWLGAIKPGDIERIANGLAQIATAMANIARLTSAGIKFTGLGEILAPADVGGQFRQESEAFKAAKAPPSKVEIVLTGATEFVSAIKPISGTDTTLKVGRNMSTL